MVFGVLFLKVIGNGTGENVIGILALIFNYVSVAFQLFFNYVIQHLDSNYTWLLCSHAYCYFDMELILVIGTGILELVYVLR